MKLSLVQATNSVRDKFNALRNEHLETHRLLEEQFKPITKRLNKVLENTSGGDAKKRDLDEILNDDVDDYDDYDDLGGDGGKKRKKLTIRKKKKNVANNKSDAIKAELKRELLNLKPSNVDDYDDDKEQLLQTPLRKRSLSAGETPRTYRKIKKKGRLDDDSLPSPSSPPPQLPPGRRITRLVSKHQRGQAAASNQRQKNKKNIAGEGLPPPPHRNIVDFTAKQYHNNNQTFTYWDDPNELVQRLRLLVSSTSAGHTGHNNEILSIVEELREAKIIA